MERYTFDGDGVFNVVSDWNTSTTTVTVGSIPDGATVAVGVASTDGWSPLDGGQLVSGSTTTLTHGHDAQLQVLISGLVGSVSLDFRKEGIPSQHSLLEQIVQNTASPIKVDAPANVPSLRQEGSWIEGVPRDEYESRLARAKVDIVYGNANTEVTVTDENLTWVVAAMTALQMPSPFTNYWAFDPTKAEFTYIGTEPQGYEISAGGLITSDSVTDTDHIQVRLVEPSGTMTGSTKRYAAGRSLGQTTSDVGFTSNGFGLFNPGDKVTLELSKDFEGTLILNDLLMAFRPIN